MTDRFDDRPPDEPPDDVERADRVGVEDEVGEEDEVSGEDGDEYEPSLAGVFGGRPEDEPPRKELGPETPSPENALFLLLGVLLGGFVVYRAVTVFTA